VCLCVCVREREREREKVLSYNALCSQRRQANISDGRSVCLERAGPHPLEAEVTLLQTDSREQEHAEQLVSVREVSTLDDS